MADLAVPKKSHPMQKHMDQIRDSHDALVEHFKGQMKVQQEVDDEQKRKTTSPAARDLGLGSFEE